jgi:hypothetical protein
MRNERGSLLVETSIAIFLTLVFVAGTLEIHRSWKKRERAILEHRNREIKKLRLEKAERIFPDRLSGAGRIGLPLPGRGSHNRSGD